jgi:hypothetical protein
MFQWEGEENHVTTMNSKYKTVHPVIEMLQKCMVRDIDICIFNRYLDINFDNFHILGVLPVYECMENKVNE